MSLYSKAAGAFSHINAIYYKLAGAWKEASAGYVKQNGAWKQFYGRNAISLYALGRLQTVYPPGDAGVWENGKLVYSAGRSYSLIQFDNYGNIVFAKTYDLFGEYQYQNDPTKPPVTGQVAAMTADLNAMGMSQLFALISNDEPSLDHTDANLEAAVYRVGGTAAIYGNANMAYRSAYMLIGKVGSPISYEGNVGVTYIASNGDSGDPNAAILKSGYIYENAWYLI